MSDKTSKNILQWQVTGTEESVASLNKITAAQNATVSASEQLKGALSGDLGVASVQKLSSAFDDQQLSIAKLRTEQQRFKDDLRSSVAELENESAAMDELNAKSGKVNGPAGLKRVGETASRLGFGEAGRGISTVGDLANFDKLKADLSSLPPAALAAGVGIAGFTVLLDLYTTAQKQAAAAAKEELDARQRALALLQTASQQEIQLRINSLQQQKTIAEAAAADANQLFANLREGVKNQIGGAALAAEDAAALVGKAAGSFQQARDSAASAQDGVSKLDTELGLLEKQSGLTAQTTDQATTAEQQLALARGYGNRQQTAAADALQQLNLATTGTEKQVRDLIAAKEREIQVNTVYKKLTDDDLAYLDKQSEAYKSGKAASDAFQASIDRDTEFLKGLTNTTLDAAVANDKATAAAKEFKDLIKDRVDATAKYEGEKTKIEDAANQKRADITDKYNAALVSASEKYATDAANALARLQDSAAKLAQSFTRDTSAAQRKQAEDDLNAAIKYQREEAKQAEQHAADLVRIRADAADREIDLVASRDFGALYRSRRETQRALDNANTQYTQEAAQRRQAFEDAASDRARDYAFQANERAIKFAQQTADLQTQYTKELNLATAAEQKAIALAVKSRDAQLLIQANELAAKENALNASITRELNLLSAGYTNAEQLAAGYVKALADSFLIQAGGALNSAGLGGIGSGLGLGVGSLTNNNNRSVSITNNIRGGNAQDIANLVQQRINLTLSSFVS